MPTFDYARAIAHQHPAIRRLAARLTAFATDRRYTLRLTEPAVLQAAGGVYPVALAPINVPSDDGRVIVDTLGWREPPLPFMASDSEEGHGDAIHVGALTDFNLADRDGTSWLSATLTFDDDDDAREYERLATDPEQGYNGVSIHMGRGDFFPVVFRDGKWERVTFDEIEAAVEDAETEEEVEAFFATILYGAFDAEVAAATQVAIPAFPEARILTAAGVEGLTNETTGDRITLPSGEATINVFTTTSTNVQQWADSLVAAADGVDLNRPPADWFTNPNLPVPTPLTVEDDGRIFGHLAIWNTCHTGYRGQCVTPPRDTADYSPFLQCSVTVDTGVVIPTGPIVVDEGHAPEAWPMARAMRHYSKTDLTAGYVAVGHDDHGIWVAGAASPRATDAQVEAMRRHPLSGDWRDDGGRYRLVAAVSVNNPGFPVRSMPLVASVDGAETMVGMITVGPEPDGYESPSDPTLVAAAVEHQADNMGRFLDLWERTSVVLDRLDEWATRDDRAAQAAALAEAFAENPHDPVTGD